MRRPNWPIVGPELLAALELMLDVFTPRDEPGPDAHVEHEVVDKARAIVAKVRRDLEAGL